MKTLLIAAVAAAAFLTGCASNNYELYAQTQQQLAMARAEAEMARYKALEAIANSGDTTARVAAVIALQQGNPQTDNNPRIAAPLSQGDTALKWASVLFPSLTQIYGINRNTEVAIVNSNNNLEAKKSDNTMIVDLVKGRVEPIVGDADDVLIYPQ